MKVKHKLNWSEFKAVISITTKYKQMSLCVYVSCDYNEYILWNNMTWDAYIVQKYNLYNIRLHANTGYASIKEGLK